MTGGTAQGTQFIGPYRLVNRLGEGGMGVVHLALDPSGRAVALKVLHAHTGADPDARRRLAREVETLRRVRHRNVAQVLDADLTGPSPYLVTAFVPGRTLEEAVRAQGGLPAAQVARLGRSLAGALEAVHAVGIVHRDLKPANVMLLDGEPVLIDFGIAHLVDESRITMTGLVMGTPGYLAPEILDGHPVTAATDWWGWGACLAYAATGRPPFGTGAATAVLDRVRRGASDLAGVDPRLAGVLTSALTVDQARRPPAHHLVDALAGVGHDAPTVATPPPTFTPPTFTPPTFTPPTTATPPAPTTPVYRPPTVAAPPPSAAVSPQPLPTAPVARPPLGGPDEPTAAGRTALVGLVTISAVASVAPGFAVLVSVLAVLAARVTGATVTQLLRRRYSYGQRPGDVAAVMAALPWRVVSSLLSTVAGLVMPVLIGVSAAFLAASALAPPAPRPNSPLPLAFGMAAAWLATWRGPGGSAVRLGGRTALGSLVRRRAAHACVLVFCGFVLLSAVLVARSHPSPDWGVFAGLSGVLHPKLPTLPFGLG